ncbi:MAG: hypothetical protein WCC94_10185, partial [Candidatus Bathyarchaeia archaeon]
AYASTLGWMRVEPQQRNAHPSEEDQSGSMNLPTSVAERIKGAEGELTPDKAGPHPRGFEPAECMMCLEKGTP